jgi:hypothetical protein
MKLRQIDCSGVPRQTTVVGGSISVIVRDRNDSVVDERVALTRMVEWRSDEL